METKILNEFKKKSEFLTNIKINEYYFKLIIK
jgi:hypothetical protein